MATAAERQEALQPSLLDRLTDHAPLVSTDAPEQAVLSRARLRQAVLRDLTWLFNATQPQPQWHRDLPPVAGTALNFGLPPLAGQLASKVDVGELERAIHAAIRAFEPRLLGHTLQVRAIEAESVLDTHNLIEFEIRAQLWDPHHPQDILLRTRLDLEAGQVEVNEAGSVGRRG